MEIGEAVSSVGDFACKVQDARGTCFLLSSPADFLDLPDKADRVLKYVGMWATRPDMTEPTLWVELCRERAKLRHSSSSGDVLEAAQTIDDLCRPYWRRWIRHVLKKPVVGYVFALLLAEVLVLLIAAVAGPTWWLLAASPAAALLLAPACRFVFRRVICHASMYNGPERDRPGFFRRNKDAIIVTLMGALAVTLLALLDGLF
ncbi:hypothetical protein [Nonomuraea typhae]|uniref:hypothetical protein n=1 Tax=Nonomuraea typhae TaxID=2603600 RepID=UPI0012FB1AA9|nr:hypothetical protein [Nonomuraea typhae]